MQNIGSEIPSRFRIVRVAVHPDEPRHPPRQQVLCAKG